MEKKEGRNEKSGVPRWEGRDRGEKGEKREERREKGTKRGDLSKKRQGRGANRTERHRDREERSEPTIDYVMKKRCEGIAKERKYQRSEYGYKDSGIAFPDNTFAGRAAVVLERRSSAGGAVLLLDQNIAGRAAVLLEGQPYRWKDIYIAGNGNLAIMRVCSNIVRDVSSNAGRFQRYHAPPATQYCWKHGISLGSHSIDRSP